MSQGTIYRTRDGRELVCQIQTDLGVETPLVLYAPLVPRHEMTGLIPKLHLVTSVGDVEWVVLLSHMAALPPSEIGAVVALNEDLRDEIIAGIDLLVSGF